jgi:hypothetical protein
VFNLPLGVQIINPQECPSISYNAYHHDYHSNTVSITCLVVQGGRTK